mmetsp:Transcript_19550/g.29607  ORF Transcript_19550/g.29607 Transcript_19550/m.29607 type:complete len:205 (+) Transcript_19550:127-741(+)
MSSLRSKMGYASPFDEAMSKPLIPTGNDDDGGLPPLSGSSSVSSNTSSSYSKKGLEMRTKHSSTSAKYKPPLPDSYEKATTNLANNTTHTFTTNMELNQMDIDAALLQERNVESTNVARSMRQIHEINLDLASLVESQQETVDAVEEHAYNVHDNAQRGVSHLQKAKDMMKDGMRNEGFMRVFFVVMGVGGLMIAIVLLLEAFY